MNLKALPEEERPRERLMQHGSEALSTCELLAILLTSGTQNRSALELAADLLSTFGSLQTLQEASITELKQVKGIGNAKAIQLKAAFALLQRLEQKKLGASLLSPEAVYRYIKSHFFSQKVEQLLIVTRDVKRNCTHAEVIAKGTLTELPVHPREIFHTAIRHQAHTFILAHNHPSGDPTPSIQDHEMTSQLLAASRLIGIELADHLILGRDTYFSFFEKGLLHRLSQY